ncbi:MAG: pentapeptide repeat-containing protein [Symploca sp. SIO2G7]|nr:pentapeptide repeat-containing protein [Symploca sp. SIO2G7]
MQQDFRGANLRGKSFRGQDLTGANFSYSDIRGANFANAILTKANFHQAQAGLPNYWTTFLLIISLLLSVISGLIPAITSFWAAWFFTPDFIEQQSVLPGLVTLIALTIFFITTIIRGLGILAAVVTVAIAIGLGLVIGLAGTVAIIAAAIGAIAVALAVATATAVASSTGGTMAVCVIVVMAGVRTISGVSSLTGIEHGFTSGALGLVDLLILVGWGILSLAVTLAVIGLGTYIALRALASDHKYSWIYRIVVVFAGTGGTSFRQANLTEASFKYALLQNTNFREAIITRTRWNEARKLDLAKVGNSILHQVAVRDLLVTGNGYKKSYEGLNLQGANLAGANLNKANLKKANLSQATLQGANLEEANLTQAQAIGSNFRRTYLTAACLEKLQIDSTTMLNRVDCRYIYLLEHPCPIKGERERRPQDPSKVFAFGSGEFERICQSLWLNIVQIYLPNSMNREAFITAYHKLMEDNPRIIPHKLQKQEDSFLLTLTLPEGTDKNQVKQYFSLLQQSSSQRQTSETSKITGSVILEEISSSVTHVISQLDSPFEQDQPEVIKLLTQLQRAIEAEADFNEEDTAEALVQVATLAGAAKNPQETVINNLAQTAIKILKGKFASLPNNAKLAAESQRLLPVIEHRLGLEEKKVEPILTVLGAKKS